MVYLIQHYHMCVSQVRGSSLSCDNDVHGHEYRLGPKAVRETGMMQHGQNLFLNCVVHAFNDAILLWIVMGREFSSGVGLSPKFDDTHHTYTLHHYQIVDISAFDLFDSR